ncbi:unnamed protein product [Miscanthus lutarioriparius]|uniref:DUF659 domain-containing protein n=1 Tax=Miscanthus lutarioriparius TaxID=422564 RepID=A0A811SEU6_9POAL|nr:unnamed protein product [Miscanthus lutarioriparius]
MEVWVVARSYEEGIYSKCIFRKKDKTQASTIEAKKKIAQATITSFVIAGHTKAATQKNTNTKSVSAMLRRTPEVVAERHKSKTSQPTIEQCTKKDKEAKQIVDDHVADFFYENGIPFNVINSRSWEIMLESIGQYGPGYRSPTMHDIREPLLERAVNRTAELRKKHEESWKEYGCTLMSDGWTDTSHRHIINFLANSPAGTFFLGSVDASSEIANAQMLADLLEQQVDKIGKEYVVQVVTDNGANFKAAGRILMERIPHLFWTPCAAHCLNLLLQDIGEIKEFNTAINWGKKVCRFLYKHGRILDLTRQKIGGDLVRPAVTRFATSYLTLANGDETPAAPEIMAAMDHAKTTIKDSLKAKTDLLKEVMKRYDNRWENQMQQKLYGAALFLNPGKFFALREKDKRKAARLRIMFNEILYKMVADDSEQSKISCQADDYEQSEGEGFSMPLAIRDRDKKNPSCERNWSVFPMFQKIRELGCKGQKSNPLTYWMNFGGIMNGWMRIVRNRLGLFVDEAIGASENLLGVNLPREIVFARCCDLCHQMYTEASKDAACNVLQIVALDSIDDEDDDHEAQVHQMHLMSSRNGGGWRLGWRWRRRLQFG